MRVANQKNVAAGLASLDATKTAAETGKENECRSCTLGGMPEQCDVARADGNAPNASVATSFVVCDKRSNINRVPIPAARLALWRCDAQAVCGFVAASLGLAQTTVQPSDTGLLPVGMACGNKRAQMLCLRVHGHVALVVGADAMPLADVIGFENGGFTLDQAVTHQMVDSATTVDPRHTPSTAKREAAKLYTQARYASWQKAYEALCKKRPSESDVWYSQQIAKTPIAQGRDASTVKKHMLA